jgi:hypothetical protein
VKNKIIGIGTGPDGKCVETHQGVVTKVYPAAQKPEQHRNDDKI